MTVEYTSGHFSFLVPTSGDLLPNGADRITLDPAILETNDGTHPITATVTVWTGSASVEEFTEVFFLRMSGTTARVVSYRDWVLERRQRPRTLTTAADSQLNLEPGDLPGEATRRSDVDLPRCGEGATCLTD